MVSFWTKEHWSNSRKVSNHIPNQIESITCLWNISILLLESYQKGCPFGSSSSSAMWVRSVWCRDACWVCVRTVADFSWLWLLFEWDCSLRSNPSSQRFNSSICSLSRRISSSFFLSFLHALLAHLLHLLLECLKHGDMFLSDSINVDRVSRWNHYCLFEFELYLDPTVDPNCTCIGKEGLDSTWNWWYNYWWLPLRSSLQVSSFNCWCSVGVDLKKVLRRSSKYSVYKLYSENW